MEKMDFEKIINHNLINLLKIDGVTDGCKNKHIHLAVALSGGSDSLALTIALHQLNYDVLAILVNHNLRVEAKKEIQQTIKTISKYNIKYIVKEWDGNVNKNLENEARNARYRLLLETCRENNIKYLCIGHHIDDQVETFLLNLVRGSGLDGLCSMPYLKKIDNIKIIRPMLNLTKQDCVNYLTSKNISWCEDASNKDTKYKRNKIRYLLEQMEDKQLLNKRICQTISILQDARETIDVLIKQTEDNIASYNIDKQGHISSVSFKRNDFLNLTQYLQKSLLTRFIMKLSKKTYKPRLYQIENIIFDIHNRKSFKRTIANCVIAMQHNSITISTLR
ncbi:MAG: tRNA lysidine(34) synthetase TilS [Rickettsiales bacterium]|nr:tRNA lysidine(34) synthetase TilS [Rickettsiales bacterium]